MTRIIAILIVFEGSVGFSLIVQSVFLIKGGKGIKEEENFTCLEEKTVETKSKWENVSHFTQLLILNQVHGNVAAYHDLCCFIFGFVCILRYLANHRRPPAALHSEAAPPPTQ